MPNKIAINPIVNDNELNWAASQILMFNILKDEIRLKIY
jgi:hypothetical protein